MTKKRGTTGRPQKSQKANGNPPRSSVHTARTLGQHTDTEHKLGKANKTRVHPARRKLLVRLIRGGTTPRNLCLVALLCLAGSLGVHLLLSEFYQLEEVGNWLRGVVHQLLTDCQVELHRLEPRSLLHLLRSLQSPEVVPIIQLGLLLLIIAYIAVQIVWSVKAFKRKQTPYSRPLPANPKSKPTAVEGSEEAKKQPPHSRPLPANPKSRPTAVEGSEETKALPKLVKQFKELKIQTEKKKSTTTLKKKSAGAGNGRQMNDGRQQGQSKNTEATRIDVETILETDQTPALLENKETFDCGEEKLTDEYDREETDTSSRKTAKEKKKRNRNKRKQAAGGEQKSKEIDSESKTTRSPVGLVNLASTCYFNAVMQNLNQSFVLREILSEQISDLPLTKSMIEFYEQMARKGNKQFSPNRLFQSLCERSPRFEGGRQQDSHELLRHLLDGLRNEEREVSPEPVKRRILTKVDRVFGGHFLTVYTCSDCTKPYHVCEPFLDISLPIAHQECSDNKATDGKLNFQNSAKFVMTPLNMPKQESRDTQNCSSNTKESESNLKSKNRKRRNDSAAVSNRPGKRSRSEGRSILDCLKAFTRTEFIAKEYLCMACHEKNISEGQTEYQMSSAIKRTLVVDPPALLTLHLKRFTQTSRGFVKCNDVITFEDKLDLSPYCSSWCRRNDRNEKNIWYSLYGVVVHDGDLSRGHYYAYVKQRTPAVNMKHFLQETFLNRDEITEENLEKIMKIAQADLNQNQRTEWRPQESVQGTWFYVSDCRCYEVPESEVWKHNAYLLFYERMTRLTDEH